MQIVFQESLVLMGLVDIDMLRSKPVLKEKDTGDVSKFLNRILGLTVEKQNMVGSGFHNTRFGNNLNIV